MQLTHKVLCRCGSCGDAMQRALALTKKIALGEEACPQMILAQAIFLKIAAFQMLGDLMKQRRPQADDVVISLEGYLIYEAVNSICEAYAAENQDFFCDATDAINKRWNEYIKNKADLPKGD